MTSVYLLIAQVKERNSAVCGSSHSLVTKFAYACLTSGKTLHCPRAIGHCSANAQWGLTWQAETMPAYSLISYFLTFFRPYYKQVCFMAP